MGLERHIVEHAALGIPLGGGASLTKSFCQFSEIVGVAVGPTTSSLVFDDLPDMAVVFVPTKVPNNIRVSFSGDFQNTNSDRQIVFTVTLDGTPVSASERTLLIGKNALDSFFVFEQWFVDLTVAAHTIKIQWKVSANTALAVGIKRTMSVVEFC